VKLANNVTAFVNMFGISDPDFVMAFASIPWENDNDRNSFINELVNINSGALVKEDENE
jgi:hypothetical protein